MPTAVRGRRRTPGFTLMELVAGLAIVGMLFVGLAVLLQQLGDARDRFAEEARRADARANGFALLSEIVYDLRAGTDLAGRFTGTDRVASFVSACRTGGGWLQQCAVTLRLIPYGDSTALLGTLQEAGTFDLWRGKGDAHFRYFTSSAPDDAWVSDWGQSIVAPGAIGIATSQYLIVLGAGGRK